MRGYFVPLLCPGRALARERFRPPRWGDWVKPEGGLWLSLWREGWGPEWGIYWILHFAPELLRPGLLEVPVWEVDLRGLRLLEAGLRHPSFPFPEDGLLVLPEKLWEAWHALPKGERPEPWWALWDVATVWLRRWPGEERIHLLGPLRRVVPGEAVEALLEVLKVVR